MLSPSLPTLALLITLLPSILAQTYTSCQPLDTTCPADPALGLSHTFNFTAESAGPTWRTTSGSIPFSAPDGASYTITQRGDAPTMQSNFYIFFGEVSVVLRAATGQGVISSIVLQSDDLDEVDWEFTGTNTTHGETNYYGKGNTTAAATRAFWHPVSSPQEEFHNYTTRWTKERIEWFIDGAKVRTLEYEDANGGQSFPQSPMNVRLGVWAGGDKDNDKYTIEWAGGETDYEAGPYTMYVQNVQVADFSSGKEYKYGDRTGSWESIEIVPGNSTYAEELSRPPPKSVAQRWAELSTGAKIAIYTSIVAVILALIGVSTICCISQRRAGRRERALADANWEKDHAEIMAHRARSKRIREEL